MVAELEIKCKTLADRLTWPVYTNNAIASSAFKPQCLS